MPNGLAKGWLCPSLTPLFLLSPPRACIGGWHQPGSLVQFCKVFTGETYPVYTEHGRMGNRWHCLVSRLCVVGEEYVQGLFIYYIVAQHVVSSSSVLPLFMVLKNIARLQNCPEDHKLNNCQQVSINVSRVSGPLVGSVGSQQGQQASSRVNRPIVGSIGQQQGLLDQK